MGWRLESSIAQLINTLVASKVKPAVVVMPDFFLDHFTSYRNDLSSYIKSVSEIAGRGGGNLPFLSQTVSRGGNAANTAAAIASLGGKAYLITRTDSIGLTLLRCFIGNLDVDLSHVKTDGRMALTIALELEHAGEKVNIMMNDPASVSTFNFNLLTQTDLDLIKKVDYTCVFNWNQNLDGTELARNVFSLTKKSLRKTFFDTGDPSIRKEKIGELMENVLTQRIVDTLSINENEAIWYASYYDKSFSEKRGKVRNETQAMECAKLLHEKLKTRVDLHTVHYAATFVNGRGCKMPTFKVPVLRATGAGDAWNAADIYGDALGLTATQRLIFANAAAAFYISNASGAHATLEDVIQLLRSKAFTESPSAEG